MCSSLEEILDHALALDPSRRGVYLRETCGGDASLMAEIEDLLRVHDAFPEPGSVGGERRADDPPSRSAGASAAADDASPGGIGGFRFERELGRGGMGRVYLAEDPGLGRAVAVKILPEPFRHDRGRIRRFRREARILASLEHPNIAAVYRFESDEDRPYMVMEYVQGATLRECLGEGVLALETALDIARQTADALAAAHAAGVVHRDLKPSNVAITGDGTVKLLDFGLAKVIAPEGAAAESTITGGLLGSPGYASPEQLRGERAGPASDAWSFGSILYEMLTGVPAFPGRTGADRMTAALTRAPDWDALRAGTPEYVRRLLGRCLAPDPSARIADFREIAAILHEQRTEGAGLGTSGGALRRLAASKKVVGWTLGAALAVLAGAIAFRQIPERPAGTSVTAERQLTFDGFARRPAISPDGRVVAYVVGDTSLAFKDVQAGAPVVACRFGGISHVFWSRDGTEVFVAARERRGGGTVRTYVVEPFGTDARPIGPPGFLGSSASPDGQRLVGHIQGHDPMPSGVLVFERATGDTITVPLGSRFSRGAQMSWSPVADLLLLFGHEPGRSEGSIWVQEVGARNGVRIAQSRSAGLPSWTPDGRSILYLHEGKLMGQRFDGRSGVPAGAPRVVMDRFDAASFSVAQTPDGVRIALESDRNTSNLWWAEAASSSWEERSPWRRLTRGTFHDGYCRLDPPGEEVVFVRRLNDAQVFTVSLSTGQEKRLTRTDASKAWPVYSPDGARIAYVETGVGVRVRDRTREKVTTVLSTPNASYLYWPRADRLLVKQSRDHEWGYWLLDLETSMETRLPPSDGGTFFHAAPSPDGSAIAVAGNRPVGADISVWIVDLEDQTERDLYDGWAAPIAWSPDGRWVYLITDDPARGGTEATAVFRVEVDGSREEPLFACPGRVARWREISMNRDCTRVVCAVSDMSSDIWIVEGLAL